MWYVPPRKYTVSPAAAFCCAACSEASGLSMVPALASLPVVDT